MRRKLKDLIIYHSNLDSQETIDLLIAFETGNLEYISAKVSKKTVNNSIGVCGYLPLELSIIYDRKNIFQYLVYKLNANLSIKNKTFDTMPFVALAFQRQSYLFELLNVDISCLYDCTNDTQRTLMHQAAISGDSEVVKELLDDFGFYKNLNEYELQHLLYDKYGCTPLYYACWFGFIQIVELLLNACHDKANNFTIGRLNSSSLKKSFHFKTSGSSDDIIDFDVKSCNDDPSDDDVFLLSSITDHKPIESSYNTKSKKLIFKDSSLAISILYNQFECVKMIMTRSLDASCIQEKKDWSARDFSAELDSWFGASMKLSTKSELNEMSNIFHELALNGAKFSHCLFSFIDSMNELSQFQKTFIQRPSIQNFIHLTDSELENYTFNYNSYFSNFFKSLTLVCNYNLERLFSSRQKVELFLKSIFLKINELFLVNNNWHMIDLVLFDKNSDGLTNHQVIASYEYLNTNRSNIEWFIIDFEQFLKSLYSNGHAYKYFGNKLFFNFLRKRKLVYYLLNTCLYSHTSATSTITQAIILNDYAYNGTTKKYLDFTTANKCDQKFKQQPLSLMALSKNVIKNQLKYLDRDLVETLDVPKLLKSYLNQGLAKGLLDSYERSKMTKSFCIRIKQY